MKIKVYDYYGNYLQFDFLRYITRMGIIRRALAFVQQLLEATYIEFYYDNNEKPFYTIKIR